MVARIWTEEQKALQAVKIRTWKPWRSSTGAKTLEGKAIVSKNRAIGAAKRQIEIAQAEKEFFAALDRLIKATEKCSSWWSKYERRPVKSYIAPTWSKKPVTE